MQGCSYTIMNEAGPVLWCKGELKDVMKQVRETLRTNLLLLVRNSYPNQLSVPGLSYSLAQEQMSFIKPSWGLTCSFLP